MTVAATHAPHELDLRHGVMGVPDTGAPEPGSDVLAGGVLLVANPAAAGVTEALVEELEHRLAPRCGALATVWTAEPGHAGEVASAASTVHGMSLVVALGGDGTAREVADGTARGLGHWPFGGPRRHGPAVLTLPGGSGNSTSRNLWGDLGALEVLDLVLDGRHRVRHLDLVRVVDADVPVLLGISTGFLAEVLIRARTVAGLHGIDRYYAAAAEVLAQMPVEPTAVWVDGALIHDGPASLVAVGGGRFRAHDFQFLPDSVLDDGELDVCVIGPLTGAAVDEVAALVPTGGHLERPEVTYRRGRRVTIASRTHRSLVAEYDGEVWDGARRAFSVEVVPAAVPVLCPSVAIAG